MTLKDTLLRNRPLFSGSIVSPTWLKEARHFQSMSETYKAKWCGYCVCTCGCNLCDDISRFDTTGLKYYNN